MLSEQKEATDILRHQKEKAVLADRPESEEGTGVGHQNKAVDHLHVLFLLCLHMEGFQHLKYKGWGRASSGILGRAEHWPIFC